MKPKHWIVISTVISLFLFINCADHSPVVDKELQDDRDSVLSFDFSTGKTMTFRLNYDVPSGYRVYFEAYTEIPIHLNMHKSYVKNNSLEPFVSGYTDENGDVTIAVQLPATVNEIYVYSNDIGVPTLLRGMRENDLFVMSEVETVETKLQVKSRSVNENYYSNWKKESVKYETIGSWNNNGVPDYLLEERISLSAKTLKIIDATLHEDDEWGASMFIHEDLHISEDANVKLHFLSNSSSRKNVLAYYTYTGDKIPSKEYINENLIILYPNLTESAIGKYAGVELKYKDNGQWSNVFPAKTNIGWVLLVDAFKDNKTIMADNINAIYSARQYNAYNLVGIGLASRPHTGLFKADGLHILSFEDQPFGRTNNPDGTPVVYAPDFKDNVFVIETNPITALPEIPDGTNPEDPSTEDGMVVESKGILAFEDLWPYKGDYDMNDVVVKYNCKSYVNIKSYKVTRTEERYTFLNDGAQHENGFGFMLNTETSNIRSVEVTPNTYHVGEALDPSQEKATIILFDNGRKVPVGTVFTMKVHYNNPIPAPSYVSAPYNPFIAINGLGPNRREVHLINYIPTAKADLSQFGTGDDLSVPAKNKYYLSNAQYPFAINIVGLQEYVIPKEGVLIDVIYPQFKKWVESLGKENKDWYNYPTK